jgi:hypothetical protein
VRTAPDLRTADLCTPVTPVEESPPVRYTVTSGLRSANLASPIPLTSRSWSTEVNEPWALRQATIYEGDLAAHLSVEHDGDLVP